MIATNTVDNNNYKTKYGIQRKGEIKVHDQEVVVFFYYGSLMQDKLPSYKIDHRVLNEPKDG